ncbi:outer membrane protein assembly factor BamB family protein [Gilvimarinus sp. F26214L]|uniref:outer membrane protein assembly factor BamB family protein n=1 Tax=Gilvimarinus sp. DZF01 TaxID=3461371 RepID=UPI0040455786
MFKRRFTLAIASACLAGSALAQDAGKAAYDQFCAACHNNPSETRAPSIDNLKQMSAQSLRFALTEGVMRAQGSAVPAEKLNELIDWLAVPVSEDDWVAGMMCGPDNREVNLNSEPSLTQFGVDLESSRFMSAGRAGLSSPDLKNLELAWAVAFPNVSSLRGIAPIVGTTMFYGANATGKLLALDTQSACVKWAYDAGTEISNSVAYGELGDSGKKALIFAVGRGLVQAVDAKTGKKLWESQAGHSPRAGITGAPVLYKDRVIVPLSASGVGTGANPKFECCDEHGAVAALDAETGEKLWTYHTMKNAEYTGRVSSTGVKQRGPSGAPIWSTPSIDVERGLVYATTGQNTSLPATKTSDAVLAIDIRTGKLKWGFQALENDVWHIGCRVPWEKSNPNCPSPEESVLKDYDFGGAAIIAKTKDGKDIILAGQKSGDVWALDPEKDGKLVWHNRFGQGTALGGVHWGMAMDGERLYVPISDPHINTSEEGWVPEPGMNAVDITTGKVLWRTPVEADCDNGRKERYQLCEGRYGLSATPLAIDQSVVAGSLDGKLYVFDGKSGEIVWEYDTLRDFETLNGIEGKGGSIDSHSIFAGNGMVFVSSGYGRFGQPAGNVLLAFRPRK